MIEAIRVITTLETIPVLDDALGLAGEIAKQTELGFQRGQKTQWTEGLVTQSVVWVPAALAVEMESEVNVNRTCQLSYCQNRNARGRA